MIDFEKALAIVEENPCPPAFETITTLKGLGRFLAGPISSPVDYPPFTKSAMDGYAVVSQDSSPKRTILETIGAGDVPSKVITPGTCSGIMTGAMLPEGADKIIRVEYTREIDGFMVPEREETGRHIIAAGENLKTGDLVLSPKRLTPQDIGVLSALGIDKIDVIQKPRIGVIATGSELKNIGEPLDKGQIYNSNGPQLCAQIEDLGALAQYYGIVPDNLEQLTETVSRGLRECNILLLSGGVSMGDYDYVPQVLNKCGVKTLFHSVAIKPGKPTFFGTYKDESGKNKEKQPECRVFGLPGNPVSTFVLFEVLVKALVYKSAGILYRPLHIPAVTGEAIKRKNSRRKEIIPVIIEGNTVKKISYHGSAHLNALSIAHGLLAIPQGVNEIKQGEEVYVRPL